MTPTLHSIRRCFEGAIPAVIATCAADGTPNVAYLSQVHYVDEQHVALSFQFFSKTRENVLANPHAMAQVIDPATGGQYQLSLEYLRTETTGPLFEYMKARLAGVASHTGMSKVFKLRGSDVYRVAQIRYASSFNAENAPQAMSRMPALRVCASQIAKSSDLASMLDALLYGLKTQFNIDHAMILMHEAASGHLYTVASMGYTASGVGSEVALGEGVIGVAAREKNPIRIAFMTSDYTYSRSLKESLGEEGEREIPFPGLAAPHSQLAVPITHGQGLLGVLYVESEEKLRFTYEDEDALMALAGQLGFAMQLFDQSASAQEDVNSTPAHQEAEGAALVVKRYAADNSIFIDDEYLIKGVAGAILWRLLRNHVQGRSEFTNRELRLDNSLRLPDFSDNLEARLILLQRRLGERSTALRIEKTGRGRFKLWVNRPVELIET